MQPISSGPPSQPPLLRRNNCIVVRPSVYGGINIPTAKAVPAFAVLCLLARTKKFRRQINTVGQREVDMKILVG